MRINPAARRREIHALGNVGPAAIAHAELASVQREISVHFYPGGSSTTWSCIVTDRKGHRRWDRTIGVGDLPVPVDELRGRDLADVLRILLRKALENLS